MNRTFALLIVSLFLLSAAPVNAGYAEGDSGIYFLESDYITPQSAAYGTGEVVFIGVRDAGFTSNTITVTVTSTDPDFGNNLEVENVQLVKFGAGDYRGVLGFETSAGTNNGKVHVLEGSTVVAQYAGSSTLTTLTSLTWWPAQTAMVNVESEHYGSAARVKVTVIDMDENSDPFERDTIEYWRLVMQSDSQATFAGPANRDYPRLVASVDPFLEAGLLETGRDTGIFEGHFFVESPYNAAPAHVNHISNPGAGPSTIPEGNVYVEDGDVIHIGYMDELDQFGRPHVAEASTTWFRTHDATIELFDDMNYNASGMVSVGGTNSFAGLQSVFIRLVDLDKQGAGNVQVRVGSSSTGQTGIVQILTESGPNSGEFMGSVPLSLTGLGGLKVKHADKLFVSYIDDRDATGLAGTGDVFPEDGLNCGTPGLSKNDPAYFTQPCIFWVEAADAAIQFITSADVGGSGVPDDTTVASFYGQLGAVEAAIMVDDPANQANTITVRITSDLDALGFDLDLDKGDDGRYRGSFDLQAAGADGFPTPQDDSATPFTLSDTSAPSLYVADGSTITATYVDVADVNGQTRVITAMAPFAETHTGILYKEKTQANGVTDTVDIYLYDPDLNTGPVKDSVKVTVTSSANPFPGIELTLEEQGDVTHRNTGLFKGTLRFSKAATGALPANTVRVPDSSGDHVVSITYTDAHNGAGNPSATGDQITWQQSNGALSVNKPVYTKGDTAATIQLYPVGLTSPQIVSISSYDEDGILQEVDTVEFTWTGAPTTLQTRTITFDVDGTTAADDNKIFVNGNDAGRQDLSFSTGLLSAAAEYQNAQDPVGVNGATFARNVFDARECTDANGVVIMDTTTGTPLPDWSNPESTSPPESPYPALRATGNGDKQLCIQVTDVDQNTHNGIVNMVHAEVTVRGIKEKISLLEVDPISGMPHPSSGTFRGYVGFNQEASTAGDAVFQVQPLDSVLVQYTDSTNPTTGNGPSYSKVLSWFPKYSGDLTVSRYEAFNSTATSFEGAGRIYIRVQDNDHNTQGTVPDSLDVQVCSETECGGFVPGTGNGWESVTLFETGQSTGVFEGYVELVDQSSSLHGVAGNGKVDVAMQGETIMVAYSDDTVTESVLYRGGNEEELKTLHIHELSWIKTVTATASKLCRDEFCEKPVINDVAGKPVFGIRNVWLEVTDDDRFADTTTGTDTVMVRVVSDSDRVGVDIELTETSGRSGVFRGILGFTNKESVAGSKISVTHGDSFTIHYNNPAAVNSAGGTEDVVVIGDGIWRDGIEGSIALGDHFYVGENDPSDPVEFTDSLEVGVMDADRNVLSTVIDSLKARIDPSDPLSGFESSIIITSDSDWDGFRYPITNDCGTTNSFCETDLDTGIFDDVLGFVQGISDANSRQISVSNRDTVYVSYVDPQDYRGKEMIVTETMQWFDSVGTGWIDIEEQYATESAMMQIIVRDQGLNKNSGATEAAHVWACSDSDGNCELVQLTEVRRDDFTKPGLFSNTFVGTVGFETNFAPRNGKVFVQDGDTVSIYYADGNENFIRSSSNPTDPGYYLDADPSPVPAGVVARTEWVLVDNTGPSVSLSATPTTVTGDTEIVTFTLSASDDGDIDNWELDFGDGTVMMSDRENVDLMGDVVTVTHRYSNGTSQFNRQAVLTVTDDGGLSGEDAVTVTVLARPEVITPPVPGGITPTDIANANEDIAQTVVVKKTSEGNVVTWTLPATTNQIMGVQIHRSDDAGQTFTTIADLPAGGQGYNERRYVDSEGTDDSLYVVTVYYAGDVGKSTTNPRTDIPGFGSAGAAPVTTDSDSGIPWWVWLVLGIFAVLIIAGAVLAIVLRQTTSDDEWDDEVDDDSGQVQVHDSPEDAFGGALGAAPEYDEPDDEPEGMDEPATSEEVHQIKCPQCATGFTASGSKPLAINCPGCGAKGMLR